MEALKKIGRICLIVVGVLFLLLNVLLVRSMGVSTWTFLLALYLLIAAAVTGVKALVKGIRKKPNRAWKIAAGGCVGAALVLFCCFSMELSQGGILAAFFLFLAGLILLAYDLISALVRRIRGRRERSKKRLVAWLLVPALFALGVGLYQASQSLWRSQLTSNQELYEATIQTDYDFEVVDGEEPIQVETSSVTGYYTLVYDAADYDLIFSKEEQGATVEMCLQAVQDNPNISATFQAYFCDFISRIGETYPDANLAALYHNLQTIQVVELSLQDYFWKSLDINSSGCYVKPENTIYIPVGTEYVEGEWGFQVLIHEFCHAARISWFSEDGINHRADFDSNTDTSLLGECMNSVFSCSLLSYEERDIAYQIPSNYLRIMLECMDNYSLVDFINHSDTYFFRKLDEATGYTNYAEVIWKLISVQRSDYLSDRIDIPGEEYTPIYDFLCDMYFAKYITPDMTEEEQRAVVDTLVDKAFYDTPEGYSTDPDYFYDYLAVWMARQTEDAS